MIEHSDLTTKVYQWLKERIMHHVFLPGDKLDVQQLADDLGVSRTPVKDAINRLTSEGLVVLRSRRGTYVATLAPADVRDLLETRLMIETWAVGRLTPAVMAVAAEEIRGVFERSARIITGVDPTHFDYPAYFALDLDLHSAIVGLTGNAVVREIHHRVWDRASAGRIYYPGDDEVFRRSLAAHEEHRAIVRAFTAGDPAALREAIEAHIIASRTHTVWLLDRFLDRGGAMTWKASTRDLAAMPVAADGNI